MKLKICKTKRIIIFFFAFSVLEEFLKLNNSDGEYFMFGNFKFCFVDNEQINLA
jgi:hypothetical protein